MLDKTGVPRRIGRLLPILVVVLVSMMAVVALGWSATSRSAQAQERSRPDRSEVVGQAIPPSAQYVLIAWNDLGMHCMNEPFENWASLPPANTLYAQLLRRGSEPGLVTTGVTLEYRIRDNTYSVGKTDFWTHVKALMGLDLQPNEGITGSYLTGTMHLSGDHFVVEAIPLTPYLDSNPNSLYPYQFAEITAKDAVTGQVLATTTTVAPVSTEMNCKTCHVDGLEDVATGNVDTNILTLHDQENGTDLMGNRPVLCAKCHNSPPLVPFGFTGQADLPGLSPAIHGKHADKTNDCYLCHPGPVTQCQRGVMRANGIVCTDCHGSVAAVANPARRPWVDLPSCAMSGCHESQFGENAGKLYHQSAGHGGLYCAACHGTQHAPVPSLQPNDNVQNINLQGFVGTLRKCSVCHLATPDEAGPHGLTAAQVSPGASPTGTATYLPLVARRR